MLAFTRCVLQSSKVTTGRIFSLKERNKLLCNQKLRCFHKFSKVCSSTKSSDLVQSSKNSSDDIELSSSSSDEIQLSSSNDCSSHGIRSSSKINDSGELLYRNKVFIENPLFEGEFNETTAAEYLSNLNEEEQKQFKVVQLEYELWSSSGFEVPDNMKDEWWASLLHNCKTYSSRKKYFRFLRKCELTERSCAIKKETKQLMEKEDEKRMMEKADGNPYRDDTYHVMLKLLRTTMNKIAHCRVTQAMMFNRPIILDMDYEEYMSFREIKSLIKQLYEAYGYNQYRMEPYDLNFTNFNPNSYIYKKIVWNNRYSKVEGLYCKTTDKSYLDLYPRENLVYLSPHAEHELQEDHVDNIYIIGCYVDLGIKSQASIPLSFAKAKKENIRSLRLPLDKYTLWKKGSKAITINQMMKIMCVFMDTKDWNQALQHLPTRKIYRPDEEHNRREIGSIYRSKYRVY